ncbi:MAG: DUF4234 domain-containing protein [Clostridia bacterium]|nr:DUF4234 domain-containing protein [Clostridia bacterium]
MKDFTVCTIALKKFNMMNLFYPVILSMLGGLVIGFPLFLVAGVLDTAFFKNGITVNIAMRTFLFLWIAIVIFSVFSFFKAVDDLIKTADSLCVGDDGKLYNFWLFLLINVLTLGIYKFIYFYRIQERLQKKSPDYNDSLITTPRSLLSFTILASIVGLGFFVASFLMMEDINNFVEISNKENGFETEEYQNWGIKKIDKKFDEIMDRFKSR